MADENEVALALKRAECDGLESDLHMARVLRQRADEQMVVLREQLAEALGERDALKAALRWAIIEMPHGSSDFFWPEFRNACELAGLDPETLKKIDQAGGQ